MRKNIKLMGRKIATAAMGLTLAVTLAACGGTAPKASTAGSAAVPVEDSAPKTAEDVYEQYKDVTKDNYNLAGTMEMVISGTDSEGNTEELPTTIDIDMDTAGDYSHGTMTMGMDYGGTKMSIDMEMYMDASGDQTVSYIKTSAGDQWMKSTSDTSSASEQLELSDEALKNADFKTTDDGYEITVALADNMDAEDGNSVVDQMLNETSGAVDPDQLQQMIKNAKMTLGFDKDCNLVSQKIDDMSLDFDSDGTSASMSYTFDLAYSNYGEVDGESVKVPDDVASSAVDDDALAEATPSATE